MTGYDVNSQPSKRKKDTLLIIIPAALALLTISTCCALGFITSTIGNTELSSTQMASAFIASPFVGIAEVGLWLRLTNRSHKIRLSLAMGILGILGLPSAIGISLLIDNLPRNLREPPWSFLINAPAFIIIALLGSLTIGLLIGLVLLVISLVRSDS